jgi:hypothetical protein
MTELSQGVTLAEQIAALTPEEALICLEAMSRRVIQIGNERIEATPLIADAPRPGRMGGQFATLRRTMIHTPDFYFYDPFHAYLPTATQTHEDLVPMIPGGEFLMLEAINKLGHGILGTFSDTQRQEWAASRPRQALMTHYPGPHPLV